MLLLQAASDQAVQGRLGLEYVLELVEDDQGGRSRLVHDLDRKIQQPAEPATDIGLDESSWTRLTPVFAGIFADGRSVLMIPTARLRTSPCKLSQVGVLDPIGGLDDGQETRAETST